VTASLLMLGTLSIEPIVTVYIRQLDPGTSHVAALAGIVMAIGAAGSIASAPRVGRLADRLGYERVITACLAVAALTLALQATVQNVWELGALRLAMGVALGGLLPTITASIRHTVPDAVVGRVLGLSVSAQYVGQVIGPVLGGVVAGVLGIRAVFVATAIVLLIGAALSRLGVRSSATDAHRSTRPAGAVHHR
jgi:MFS family permease